MDSKKIHGKEIEDKTVKEKKWVKYVMWISLAVLIIILLYGIILLAILMTGPVTSTGGGLSSIIASIAGSLGMPIGPSGSSGQPTEIPNIMPGGGGGGPSQVGTGGGGPVVGG